MVEHLLRTQYVGGWNPTQVIVFLTLSWVYIFAFPSLSCVYTLMRREVLY